MLKIISGSILLSIALFVTPAQADELGDAAQTLCEKVKSCAIAQMEGQNIPEETRQMMQPMLDNMCTQVRGKVGEVPTGHPLYKPAVACMESMGAMTTPECEEYEELAREAGE